MTEVIEKSSIHKGTYGPNGDFVLNIEGEIYDGLYGSMHYRISTARHLWRCHESSDYEYVGVVDDFGYLVPVGPIINKRGY